MESRAAAAGYAAHERAVERLLASYRAIPAAERVRLAKPTSNLFRARHGAVTGLDVSGLDTVLAVDTDAGTVDVGGMCRYETAVAGTLPHQVAPAVVPQLKTITVGGAVTGLGIESTSFRRGLVHETVEEIDILTGSGELVTARPDNEYADLFHGFPNSFGTLGYATRVRVRTEPVLPFVELTHLHFGSVPELLDTLGKITATEQFDGQPVHYLDGVVFDANECYLTLGRQTAAPGPVSDYTGQRIYYRSLQEQRTDRLTIHDYLWRWDTDWFWCSRAFGAQQPLVRRLWPRKLRRSEVYFRLVGLDRRWRIADRIQAAHRRPPEERVVQDVELPLDHTADFIGWFLQQVPIRPLWLCPIRPQPDARWPLYPMAPGITYVNVGFWSTVPGTPGEPGATNRAIEARVAALRGHKSLYSEAFYTEDEFAGRYGGPEYAQLKRRYDPDGRLLTMYQKVVLAR